MRKRIFLILATLALSAPAIGAASFGCSTVIDTDPNADGGKGGDDTSSTGVGPGDTDGGRDALPDYVDPGCPEAGPPVTDYRCDPYNQPNGTCSGGQACYIFVQYPQKPCDQEIYGSLCVTAGSGQQGDPCGGTQQCAGGFVCVIAGSGTQCVELCKLSGQDGCPAGLVCEAIDIDGFGGCL
jgi:hypothetical protein